MKIKYLSVILVLLACIGCERKEYAPPIETEVFKGELEMISIDIASLEYTDDVVLTVKDGQYRLEHIAQQSKLCSSAGEMSSFGKAVIQLDPTEILSPGNCDTIRIPRGQFKARYNNDSLILGPATLEFNQQEEWEYTFRLGKLGSL
jgi:hypothetical protein